MQVRGGKGMDALGIRTLRRRLGLRVHVRLDLGGRPSPYLHPQCEAGATATNAAAAGTSTSHAQVMSPVTGAR